MNGNFDYTITINDSTNGAELTPFWEMAEQEAILSAKYEWYCALCASDYEWEYYFDRLHSAVREAEEFLAGFGIRPSVADCYSIFGW